MVNWRVHGARGGVLIDLGMLLILCAIITWLSIRERKKERWWWRWRLEARVCISVHHFSRSSLVHVSIHHPSPFPYDLCYVLSCSVYPVLVFPVWLWRGLLVDIHDLWLLVSPSRRFVQCGLWRLTGQFRDWYNRQHCRVCSWPCLTHGGGWSVA